MKVKVIPIIAGVLNTVSKAFIKGENTSGDHPNDSILKIDQNTEKSPGDLLSLKLHQVTLVWKALNRVNNNKKNKTKLKRKILFKILFEK